MSDDIRELLCRSSDQQLDASMFPLIRKWDPEPTALQVLEVLDQCTHVALASSFIVKVLQTVYDASLMREGKTHEEIIPLATWRNR